MCLAAHEQWLKSRKIQWKTKLNGPDNVKIDPAELHAVLQNLVDNALYWLGRKEEGDKTVLIETKKSAVDGRVDVMVHDSGPGVAVEDSDKIFAPGYTRRPNGAGMGLTVAGEIITHHDGQLGLAPKGRLGGATFEFSLPIDKSRKPPA
jgi:signal transduction histidine kinase